MLKMAQRVSSHGRVPARLRDGRRGVVLILMALALTVILGMSGVATDGARLLITKNELQNFTDSAALAAVLPLDGTTGAFDRADEEVAADGNRWNFDTQRVTEYTVEFGPAPDGPWETAPTTATGFRFVRVSAAADVPLFLARALPGVGATASVNARSVAGLILQNSMADGVFPFSPDAHDIGDPDFGFLLGKYYTLKYDKAVGNPTNGPSPTTYLLSLNDKKLIGCPADMAGAPGFRPGMTVGTGSSSERGFIDLTDRGPTNPGGGSNLIRDAILGRTSFGLSIDVGYRVIMEPGNKMTINSATGDRVQQDTDGCDACPRRTPRFYATAQSAFDVPPEEEMNNSFRSAYATGFPRPPNGNGRRIVTTPVNDPATNIVVGFAAFFLPLEPCEDSPPYNGRAYNPCCGEYIGSVTLNSGAAPGPGAGLFRPFLVR